MTDEHRNAIILSAIKGWKNGQLNPNLYGGFCHYLDCVSTISVNFGVHTRNWTSTYLQPLEFNFEFQFFEDFEGRTLPRFRKESK